MEGSIELFLWGVCEREFKSLILPNLGISTLNITNKTSNHASMTTERHIFGVSLAVIASRTITAPLDRLKLLSQVIHNCKFVCVD